jgi:hypothetical protein
MGLIGGREEIVYLLTAVINKFENVTNEEINRNTNRKNYTQIAEVLSEISNRLPFTSTEFEHEEYDAVSNTKQLSYPYRKYDITGGQIKDAYKGIVEKPRPYLVDACYIYLYQMGRKGFEAHPVDANLVLTKHAVEQKDLSSKIEKSKIQVVLKSNYLLFALFIIAISGYGFWYNAVQESNTIKNDVMLLSYQPTDSEIAQLQGVWSYYTSAPQARSNEKNRYHKVVNNLIEITYKDGYFVFTRHGATINHYGYIQYMSPGVISINSYVKKNSNGDLESPSHSLAHINKGEKIFYALSVTWNFESENNSDVIGVRNVYVKEGDSGQIQEIKNTPQNAFCNCKVVRWYKNETDFKDFELRYQTLENMSERFLQPLLDENSILLKVPKNGVLLTEPDLER